MVNYPFVYPSAKENAPDIFKQLGEARYPRVDTSIPSAPPLGGINLAVSSFSEHKDEAFDAIKCMIRPENQIGSRPREGCRRSSRASTTRRRSTRSTRASRPDPGVDRGRRAAPGDPRLPGPVLAIQRAIHPLDDIPLDDLGGDGRRPARHGADGAQRGGAALMAASEATAEPEGKRQRATGVPSPSAGSAGCSARRRRWRCCWSPRTRSATRSCSASSASTCASRTSASSSGSATTSTC